MTSLFVYGSLAPGREHEQYLKDLNGRWEPAVVHGRLYEKGTPDTEGYPALSYDPSSPPVKGWLFHSTQLDDLWPTLDEFEGAAYRRIKASVVPASGNALDAYIYVLNKE